MRSLAAEPVRESKTGHALVSGRKSLWLISETTRAKDSESVMQRKSFCPCDGGCPRCLGIQAKLTIGQPDDPYEQEADRIADQVMRMPDPQVQRKEGCPGCSEDEEEKIQTKPVSEQITPLIQRQAEPEEENEEEESIQAKGAAASVPHVSPSLEARIHSLKGGGQPLDAATRTFFEPRFNADFSHVRIHTNEKATDSAREIGALAYTVGNHIVFGRSQYCINEKEDKRLLGHELTHTLQQNKQTDIPAHDQLVRELGVLSFSKSLDRSILSRQPVPMVRPPIQTPQTPNLRVIRGGRLPEVEERLGKSEQSSFTLEDILARAKRIKDREMAIWELERPVATLIRGGSPPDFISDKGIGEAIGNWGQVRYKRRALHVLNAIEYRVSRANTEKDLVDTLNIYIPSMRSMEPNRLGIPFPTYSPYVFPKNIDSDGTILMAAYSAALAKRVSQKPSLQHAKVTPQKTPQEARRRGCLIKPSAALGGDLLASMFCQVATGCPFEYKVTSPTFGSVTFDAMLGNTVYECKCGYGRLLKALGKEQFWARIREDKLDEQMLRQTRIASDCGLQYRYIVSNELFARFLRSKWPEINIILRPWEPCD